MSAPRCFYADPKMRGKDSPECFPGTFAHYVVRCYFDGQRPRREPLHLCRAHAEFHAHLNPRPIRRATKVEGR
jgi:hypothetical protein